MSERTCDRICTWLETITLACAVVPVVLWLLR